MHITMLACHHSVFYRLDALPAAQPSASKHWTLRFPKFRNPKWPPATIIEMEKLLYLYKCLTDFDVIWHGDASGTHASHQPLKLVESENLRWWSAAILQKLKNSDISATVWLILTNFHTVMHLSPLDVDSHSNFQNLKIQNGCWPPS